MSAPGFFLYTRDFRDGVRRLAEDEVGVYVLFLTVLYETPNGRMRDHDADVADDMGRDVRVWKRVKKRLIELGKIVSRDGWLSNPKADIEIAKRQALSEVRSEAGSAGGKASGKSRRARSRTDYLETSGEDVVNFSENSSRSSADLPEKSDAKINEINAEPEALASLRARVSLTLAIKEDDDDAHAREISAAPDRPPRPPPDPLAPNVGGAVWLQRLAEIKLRYGGVLDASPNANTAKHLRALCEPHAGLACDWERDVAPAVEEVLGKYLARNETVSSLGVVAKAALRNRDQRLAGLPAPDPKNLQGAHRDGKPNRSGSIAAAGQWLLDRVRPADDGPAIDGELCESESVPAKAIGAG